MELQQLYCLLELPEEVKEELEEYGKNRNGIIKNDVKKLILEREFWDEGVKMLQNSIGDDPSGIKVLWEMLNIACESYKKYKEKRIPIKIYTETMKFCTRFIKEHYYIYGQYKFVWAWWFPRQLALQEFRIGCLEYEFIKGNEDIISVHIPSDADLKPKSVFESLKDFFDFRKCYFPEWEKAQIYCESWLLSPVLKDLLDHNSNIINFQKCFIVEHTDYDSMAVLDWVFPGCRDVSEKLPENTRLQREMKKYLLRGGRIGWSKGCLNEAYIMTKIRNSYNV